MGWANPLLRILGRSALVVLMAAGSIAVWVGSPLGWMWLASRLADTPNTGLGPYMLLGAGLIASSVALTWVLARLDRAYRSLSEKHPRHLHNAVLRASGQERLEKAQAGPLGVVMTISVALAFVVLIVWVESTGHPFIPIPL